MSNFSLKNKRMIEKDLYKSSKFLQETTENQKKKTPWRILDGMPPLRRRTLGAVAEELGIPRVELPRCNANHMVKDGLFIEKMI